VRAAWRWARWEASRELEVTPMIRFITWERFVKAALLIFVGISLLTVRARDSGALQRLATDAASQLNLEAGLSSWHRVWDHTLTQLGRIDASKETILGVGAILYGLLEGLEGLGLWLRRRWAEYLVLLATGLFLPLEIRELLHGITLFRAGALLVNLVIIGYLVWRKRLFLERPGTLSPS
jgi:uncharacterized membrane protein (DUF2068 family)